MRSLINILLILLFPLQSVMGQNAKKIFYQEDLFRLVQQYHPVTIQAGLQTAMGESTVQSARGSFDPVLKANVNQKNFDGKEYFNIIEAGLEIPTWYGLKINSEFDRNRGAFLNPENDVPQDGLWNTGVSLSLGRGLFIDKRRAVLEQAKIYAEATGFERQKMLNDLFYSAVKSYWKWVNDYNRFETYSESLSLADKRFQATKRTYELGDIPAIDTLEAFIQVQTRQIFKSRAQLDYQNSTNELSNFLWNENFTPLLIGDSLRPPKIEEIDIPQKISPENLQLWLTVDYMQHPTLQLTDFELTDMSIERRIRSEALKPVLDIRYNILSESISQESVSNNNFNEYQWGLTFQFPLFLREQRGNLRMTEIKIQETQYKRIKLQQHINNLVKSTFNDQSTFSDQVDLLDSATRNYFQLLAGEKLKLQTGESSLFLVNTRELSYINSKLKLIEAIKMYHVSWNSYHWSKGQLYTIYK